MRLLVPFLATATLTTPQIVQDVGSLARPALQRARSRILRQAPQSLADAERAFAHLAQERGTSHAFSAFFAPDGLVFQPRPTSGHQLHDGKPDDGSRLNWEPSFAEVSASGDLGWTTGLWQWRKEAADPAPATHGHFVSVWRKQPDGTWKVALDLGISHAAPPSVSLAIAPTAVAPSLSVARQENSRRELLASETLFQAEASAQGLGAALATFGAEDLRAYREGLLPSRSKKASLALVAFDEAFLRAEVEGSGISAAGDLGYTYGLAQARDIATQEPVPFSFLRIWRKVAGSWQIALDIQIPASKP